MRTLLLAAGSSQAYADAGHHYPKNLVEVAGRPLLEHVVEGLGELAEEGRMVAVLLREEARAHRTDQVLGLLEPTAATVLVGETRGAACSALLACEKIDPAAPLVVTSGDALIEADLSAVVAGFDARGLDAGAVVFPAVHPRWSFVKLQDGLVVQASEKDPISRSATAGFYWFRHADLFFTAVQRMIEKGASVDGQFFVCPALNELVLDGLRIGVHEVARDSYFSFREPIGVTAYEDHLAATAARA